MRRKTHKKNEDLNISAGDHKDEDGHIKRMIKLNGRNKVSRKEKRKNERKKKSNKTQPITKSQKENRGKKRKIDDLDLFHDDELLNVVDKEKDYDSDNSDIIDDLPDKKKRGDDTVIIDQKFLNEMETVDDPDDRMMRALEKKLGIARKKKRQMKKLRESEATSELKKFVEQKRLQKKQQEELKKQNEAKEESGDDENEAKEESGDDENLTADPEGDVPVNDYDDDHSDGFYDGKGDILDELNDLLDFSRDTTLDREEHVTQEPSDEEEEEIREEKKQTDSKYVPPHLRNKSNEQRDDKFLLLQKQLRGLINRLTLGNIVGITNQCIQLYEKSSKNDFHEILCDTVLDSTCDTVNLKSEFILVYASVVVALHNTVGMEVGAHFVEQLIKRFEQYRQERQKATNLIMLISHIYNLGLVFCALIYDIIRIFCDNFNELNIELLFKLLKSKSPSSNWILNKKACGFQLRADDPSSLKDIIQVIQTKAAELKKETEERSNDGSIAVSKRITFMLDMIYDLKNNKKRKTEEDAYEQYKSLRKTIKDIQKQHKSSTGENTLRISYKDILNSSRSGRWWLVGSAWAGPSTDDDNTIGESVLDNKDNIANVLKDIKAEDQSRLEKLAREQRMTTELRRTIFYIIMASDDFMDAFQKLAKLGLKKNDREVARVVIHCCCQEKSFNLYYSLLCQRVCSAIGKNGPRTFQFTFYEHFKELSTYKMRKVANLSKLLSLLIESGTLSLAMLKIVDFNELSSEQEIVFFRLLFTHIMLDLNEADCSKIFLRLAKVRHCDELKEALVLFLYQFINKEFRKTFVRNILAVRDITKKNDDDWLDEQEAALKQQAKTMKKILKIEFDANEDDKDDYNL